MKFYTSVARYGNSILYRGYEDGQRIKKKIKFKPTLYVKGRGNSEFTALDGTNVDAIKLDSMKDAKEFVEKYEEIENFTIYGNTNYIAQFIAHEFPNEIKFDRSKIRVHNIDIEVFSGDTGGGFPEPKVAKHPVTSITISDSVLDTYYVWSTCEYDEHKTEHKDISIRYLKCADEATLLKHFVAFWHEEFTCPDIITGWNTRTFDIPYLVNRIIRVLGEDYAKRLSPWGMVEEKIVTIRKKQVQIYDIVGIAQLDYLDLFQKFGYTFGPQENYRLDTIANVVLGERKMDYSEYGSLANLYKQNPQLYVDYNIKDALLVDRMEDKIALLTLGLTLAYKAGVNYSDTMGTTAIWDQLIHRWLLREKTIVLPNKNNPKIEFEGAFVKPPQIGRFNWIASFDVNSMHPNLIVLLNMSPETLMKGYVEHGMNVETMLNGYINEKPDLTMSATGQYFSKEKQGILPRLVEALYDERVSLKAQTKQYKKEYEACDRSNKQEMFRIERMIAQFDNAQTAVKILLNSLFGATGNRFFRYYAIEIAESITVSSQLVIRWAEKHINAYLNKLLKTNDVDYVIAGDTDSNYICLDALVQKIFGEVDMNDSSSVNKVVDFLDKVCQKIEEDVLIPAFKQLSQNMNAYKERIVMKREGIASRGIWTAKKRYILNVIDNEGVRYAKPKLKIMGIEAIKSSTPAPCRDAFKDLFKILISGTEEETQKFIANFRNTFAALPAEDKAFPRGVSSVKEYVDAKIIYKKGTPINSRAAILYNHMLKQKGVTNKYEEIKDGEKIKYIHLNPKNPLREDVIGFFTVLPPEFGLHQFIDNDTQFEKAFLDPAKLILDAIGWKAEESASLEDFFGG